MIKKIAIISLLAFCLSACGIRGDLDKAPPMWGKAKEEYKAKKAEDKNQEKSNSQQSNQTEKP